MPWRFHHICLIKPLQPHAASISPRLKVKDVLKSQHSAKWVEAINIEINSLTNNFKCVIPEEIDYEKG